MQNKRCVIFDLDGTLVDSELLSTRVLLEMVPRLQESADTLTRAYRGWRFASIIADVEQRVGGKLADSFETSFRERVAEVFAKDLQTIPEVPAMLASLRHTCCVASSAPLAKIHHALEVTGLDGYFNGNLFSCYQINSWKPAPDIFLYTAREMGFAPAQCVVVEDSEVGVQAGTAAGMTVFQYEPSAPPEKTTVGYRFNAMEKLTELL